MDFREVINPNVYNSDKQFENNPKYYLDTDGLYHCQKCKTAVQCFVKFPNLPAEKVRCICKCQIESNKQFFDENRQQALLRARRLAFPEPSMVNNTFENSIHTMPQLELLKAYCTSFSRYRNYESLKTNYNGLLLYGNTGTGKSYGACCVVNRLIGLNYPCLFTSFKRLEEEQRTGTLISNLLRGYELVVFDDLGTERKSEYMKEIVYDSINCRYEAKKPMIVTTNLKIEELKQTTDIDQKRIYDRIIERCFPVEFKENVRVKVIEGGKTNAV